MSLLHKLTYCRRTPNVIQMYTPATCDITQPVNVTMSDGSVRPVYPTTQLVLVQRNTSKCEHAPHISNACELLVKMETNKIKLKDWNVYFLDDLNYFKFRGMLVPKSEFVIKGGVRHTRMTYFTETGVPYAIDEPI